VQHIMNSIASVCLMARANFEDPGEIYRIWRYVNAMHCTAYCGLTDHLTEANFFMPLSKKHGLLGAKKIQVVESAAVRNVGIDANGVRACSMFEVRLTPARTSALFGGRLARKPVNIPKGRTSPRSAYERR